MIVIDFADYGVRSEFSGLAEAQEALVACDWNHVPRLRRGADDADAFFEAAPHGASVILNESGDPVGYEF